MLAAGEVILECYRVLRAAELNIVGEVLRGQDELIELNHYPDDDVFDRETQSQYYYHAHRGMPGEHGHFHTFLRQPGMPAGIEPIAFPASEPWPSGDSALSHLVGISMDAWGYPIGLFTTNRWVTDEAWYKADDVIRLLERFRIDHSAPSAPVNRWISAMFVLFRPQVKALIRARDAKVAKWLARNPGRDVKPIRCADRYDLAATRRGATRRGGAWLAALGLALPWVAGPAAAAPTVTQVPCQFLESEGNLDRGYKSRDKADCEAINAQSGAARVAQAKPLQLKAGAYVFRVINRDVPYELGFWLRGASLASRIKLPSVSGGGLFAGKTQDYAITLKPGEYLYSCPLNTRRHLWRGIHDAEMGSKRRRDGCR